MRLSTPSTVNPDTSLQMLIELGTKGYYPLFLPEWLNPVLCSDEIKLTKAEKRKVQTLLRKLERHKTIDRKQTLILSMTEKDRDLLVRGFYNMVENKILDKGPAIQ